MHNPDFRGATFLDVKATEKWKQSRPAAKPVKCKKRRRTKKWLAQFELSDAQKAQRLYIRGW